MKEQSIGNTILSSKDETEMMAVNVLRFKLRLLERQASLFLLQPNTLSK